MAVGRRRLLWVLVVGLTVLVGLGAYVYFLSTDRVLRRAEEFQFRRMQVARVPGSDSYRFFFATNREPGVAEGPLGERFGAVRSDGLTLGSFDTEIEPSLGLGMWIDAGRWLLDEEIRIENVRPLEQADFVADLRAMVAASPQRALLMMVHGFRTDFDLALRATAFLAHILDVDAPILVFDWPGNQGQSLGGYRRAQGAAQASGAELAAALRLVVREVQPERLWLMANSMGAEVVVDAFHALRQDLALADPGLAIDELILTAPDVDRARFNEAFRDGLEAIARHTTVYVSSNDRALLVSRVINRGPRLGQSTLSKSGAEPVGGPEPEPGWGGDPGDEPVDEVEAVLELMGPGERRLELVDVTPVNRTRNFHNFSLEVPEFFDDIFLRLTNAEIPLNRLRYELRTPDGKVYSVLTRGR